MADPAEARVAELERLSTLALTRRDALLLQLRQWSLLLPAVGAAGFLDGPVPPPLLGLGLDPQPNAFERGQDRGQEYHAIGDLDENAKAYLERFDTRKHGVNGSIDQISFPQDILNVLSATSPVSMRHPQTQTQTPTLQHQPQPQSQPQQQAMPRPRPRPTPKPILRVPGSVSAESSLDAFPSAGPGTGAELGPGYGRGPSSATGSGSVLSPPPTTPLAFTSRSPTRESPRRASTASAGTTPAPLASPTRSTRPSSSAVPASPTTARSGANSNSRPPSRVQSQPQPTAAPTPAPNPVPSPISVTIPGPVLLADYDSSVESVEGVGSPTRDAEVDAEIDVDGVDELEDYPDPDPTVVVTATAPGAELTLAPAGISELSLADTGYSADSGVGSVPPAPHAPGAPEAVPDVDLGLGEADMIPETDDEETDDNDNDDEDDDKDTKKDQNGESQDDTDAKALATPPDSRALPLPVPISISVSTLGASTAYVPASPRRPAQFQGQPSPTQPIRSSTSNSAHPSTYNLSLSSALTNPNSDPVFSFPAPPGSENREVDMDENSDAVHAGNSNGNGHGVHSSNGADVTQSTKRPAPVQVSLHPVSINPALLYPQYTLPSIKALPAEYARRSKGKDRKRRDKDKDKDKGEKERDKERERQKDAVVAHISNSLTLPTTALTTTPAGNSTAAEDVKPSKDKDEKPTIDTGVGAGASNGSVVKRDERKDEFEPLGLNRWGAMLRANPVHRALAHSTKALSSRDWNIAETEIRIIRVFERIEELKTSSGWAFRQVRRKPGTLPHGIAKTHRDFLMDEMRWMRTDFREERKWKLTMAFQLAHAAKKWHTFADRASRVAAGICISHVPPTTGDGDGRADASPARTVMEEMPDARDEREAEELLAYGGEDGSDVDPDGDGEDDDSPDPEELGDADRQGSREQQNGSAEPSFSAGDRMLEPSMKMEDLDDRTVLIQTGEGEGMILEKYVDPPDVEMKDEDSSANGGNARSVGQPPVMGLKPESNDPIVGSGLAMDNNSEASKPHNKAPHPALLPVREKLSFSDPSLLFVPEEDIDIVRGIAQLNMREGGTEATTLTTLFPDLSFYGLLDAVPPKTVTDAKKKSGRKEDKDDPYRRPDDVHYSRLMPMNQFMYTKPTLLSTLHPVEHWGDDNMWHNLNNMPINIDIETPSVKPPDESLCTLFDKSKSSSAAIAKDERMDKLTSAEVRERTEARKRSSDHLWSGGEDLLLKSLCDRYPNNWRLICDSFNSSRIPTPGDKRSLWDCLERWKIKWGPSSQQPQTPDTGHNLSSASGMPQSPATEAAAISSMTRGARRMPSGGVPPPARIMTMALTPGGDDTKKRKHHMLVYDTVRRSVRKREAAAKTNAANNQRKSNVIHETHSEYRKLPKLTPVELAKLRSEKEAADIRQRKQAGENELRRQHAQHMQHMTPQQQIQQAAMQQLAARNAVAVANAAGQVGGVPQIRNIAQQTRVGTPLSTAAATAAANARMSPQHLQLSQAQASQRALHALQAQHAHAQAQAQAQAQAANGGVNGGTAHLSPPFAARTMSGSPAIGQAQAAAAAPLVGASNSPRPPSVQAASSAGPSPVQVPAVAAGVQRPTPVAGTASSPYQAISIPQQQMVQPNFTQEQLQENAVRIQQYLQQQMQLGVMRAQQAAAFPPQTSQPQQQLQQIPLQAPAPQAPPPGPSGGT